MLKDEKIEIFQGEVDKLDLHRGAGRPCKWPFPIMEVGEYFFVTNKKDRNNFSARVNYWNKKFSKEGRRFVVKTTSVGPKVQRIK